jgi:hypothetical protein
VLLGLGPRALGACSLMLGGGGLSPSACGALLGLSLLLVGLKAASVGFLPQFACLFAATLEPALALLSQEHPEDQEHHECSDDDENDFHVTLSFGCARPP